MLDLFFYFCFGIAPSCCTITDVYRPNHIWHPLLYKCVLFSMGSIRKSFKSTCNLTWCNIRHIVDPNHAAMRLYSLSGEKIKSPPTKHTLCLIWFNPNAYNQAATLWSHQCKADVVIISKFSVFTIYLVLKKCGWIFRIITPQCWKLASRASLQLKLLFSLCQSIKIPFIFNINMQDAKHK